MFVNKYHEKAQNLLDQNKLDKSLEMFNKALQQTPESPQIYSNRGVVFLHMGDKLRCLTDMNKAVQLDPEYSYRYSSRAYARDFFGDIEGAIQDYEKAISLDPDDAVAHNNLGLLLEKQGYTKKAKETYSKADELAGIDTSFKKRMDELDEKAEEKFGKVPAGEPLQPKKLEEDKKETTGEILKNTITKKETFKEFIQFVFRGFKMKEEDKND